METADLLLAIQAVSIVARIANDLGAEIMSFGLIDIGSHLARLHLRLKLVLEEEELRGSTIISEDNQGLREKIYRILQAIEKACTWPKVKDASDLSTLISLAKIREVEQSLFFWLAWFTARTLHNHVREGLRSYASNQEELRNLLDVIENAIADKDQEPLEETSSSAPPEGPGYPAHVNNELHEVLSKHVPFCSCQHLTRLRLHPRDHIQNGAVCFELLFSTHTNPIRSSVDTGWIETKMVVSSGRQVTFSGDASTLITGPFSEGNSEVVPQERFCTTLNCPDNTLSLFQIENSHLKRTDKKEGLERKAKPANSIPLSQAFMTHRMSEKTRCILAYILAKSVWQYYDSDWMRYPWTRDNVHLLHDQQTEQQVNSSLCLFRPYFAPDFLNGQYGISECIREEGLWHPYPKVLALGILLIEVARGEHLDASNVPLDYSGDSTNQYVTSAWKVLKEEGLFGKRFGRFVSYSKAVKNCLDFALIYNAPYNPAQQEPRDEREGLEERRAKIYEQIVYPLEELLKQARWFRDVEMMMAQLDSELETTLSGMTEPMRHTQKPGRSHGYEHALLFQSSGCSSILQRTSTPLPFPAGTAFQEGKPPPLLNDGFKNSEIAEATLLGQTRTTSPEEWLKRFERISGFVKSNAKRRRPIKIAVLDTGCDLDASVFKVPGFREEVISRWKDMVNGEAMPIDEDPGKHGTRIVSVLLRIAPNTEIFVARVASNPKMLQRSHKTIADAIVHSARNWDVDVVSMSFGFDNEITVIKNAIEEAHSIKNQSIVFLAAAGNDGYNSSELFPAYLDSVISIRGTDYTGNFVASLNPRQHPFNKRESAYGTLGKDFPYVWPDKDACKTISGCSIATPVAAAIVALILNCATAEVFDDKDQKLLRTRRAILGVFKQISESQGGLCYLAPWDLFSTSDDEYRVSILRIAIRKLPVIA